MRLSAASLSSALILPRDTWRSRLPVMMPIALGSISALASSMRTLNPETAQTWAMPLPICPAPITPIVLIMASSSRLSGADPCRASGFVWQGRRQLRHDLEQVADQAVIGDLED